MDMKEREIQYCNPEELIPYEKNPRDNRAALDAIELSIEEYGFTNPILVNEEKVILDGLTEAQQKAYRLADNKLSELSIWDEDLLKEELEEERRKSMNRAIYILALEIRRLNNRLECKACPGKEENTEEK